MKRWIASAVALVLVLLVGAVAFAAWSQRQPNPSATLASPPQTIGREPVKLDLTVTAPSGHVRSLDVRVVQGSKEQSLLAEPRLTEKVADAQRTLTLDPKALGLAEGPAELRVFAGDDRWRPKPDASPRLVQAFTVDLTPPTIELRSATEYIKQAGTGVIVWRAKGAAKSAVRCGKAEFPGTPGLGSDADVMVALFTVPYADPPSDPVIHAEDEAGNSRTVSVPVRFLDTKFTRDTVNLDDTYMRTKVGELNPQSTAADGEDLVNDFVEINKTMRKANEAKIREVGESLTATRPLFSGAFRQQPNSKVLATFPQERDYKLKKTGQTVDTEWHLGMDLASNAKSPVLASNAGRVAFAGDNGIYGNMVILDHGLGLATLYGHLSEIAVTVGQDVTQGESLGHTGVTGLAAGDHLHFAFLVHGTYTNPLDWFDGQYITDRIAGPLREAGLDLPGLTDVSASSPKAAKAERHEEKKADKKASKRRR